MTSPARHSRRTRGFSIVELMVSLALSSFVILAVVGIYSGSRESYTAQDEISRLHENVRIGVGLEGSYEVTVVPVAEATPDHLSRADLVVVGEGLVDQPLEDRVAEDVCECPP